MAKQLSHPRKLVEGMTPAEMAAFFDQAIDRDYFDTWIQWIAGAVDFSPSDERSAVLFDALTQARFTNAEIGIAGDYIVANNERFPVPSHFIRCPDLGRNATATPR